jgi:hypothetical protein
MLFYLPKSKRKEPVVYISFFTLPMLPTQKQGWNSMKYFFLEEGSTYEKVLKALTSRLVVYIIFQVNTEMPISLAVFLGGTF